MLQKIAENIYFGDRLDALHYDKLRSKGITALLNVAEECTQSGKIPADFISVKVGLKDTTGNPDFLKSLAIISLGALVENKQKVLIFSNAGKSRNVYIAFRYLAEKENRGIESLYQEFFHLDVRIGPLNYHV